MKEWAIRFWNDHGDRIIFMSIVTAFGIGFRFVDMGPEGKTLLIAVATLALNKARGVSEDKKPPVPDVKPPM